MGAWHRRPVTHGIAVASLINRNWKAPVSRLGKCWTISQGARKKSVLCKDRIAFYIESERERAGSMRRRMKDGVSRTTTFPAAPTCAEIIFFGGEWKIAARWNSKARGAEERVEVFEREKRGREPVIMKDTNFGADILFQRCLFRCAFFVGSVSRAARFSPSLVTAESSFSSNSHLDVGACSYC